ncbi:MAG: hypothetical protein ABSE92_10750 [Terriglobales bacterium]|jgi:hypothetical protein
MAATALFETGIGSGSNWDFSGAGAGYETVAAGDVCTGVCAGAWDEDELGAAFCAGAVGVGAF